MICISKLFHLDSGFRNGFRFLYLHPFLRLTSSESLYAPSEASASYTSGFRYTPVLSISFSSEVFFTSRWDPFFVVGCPACSSFGGNMIGYTKGALISRLHGFSHTNPVTLLSAPLVYHIYFTLYTLFSSFG